MFFEASGFNQDIGEWDVSHGSNFVSSQKQWLSRNWLLLMKYLFVWIIFSLWRYCLLIPTTKGAMFYVASAFDQDIGEWDVSEGTDFVSNQKYYLSLN